MAVSFDKLKPGMRLLDIHRYRMGNTTMTKLGLWYVEVISVDTEKRTAVCRWNNNPPTTYVERKFRKLYLKPTKAYLGQLRRDKQVTQLTRDRLEPTK